MDTWAKFDAERESLCRDLAGLDATQWDTPSLCTDWKVRHVVAHLIQVGNLKYAAVIIGTLRNGRSPERYMAALALDAGRAAPESLLSRLRATVGERRTPLRAKPIVMLQDTVCHSADIRRPLRITRELQRTR